MNGPALAVSAALLVASSLLVATALLADDAARPVAAAPSPEQLNFDRSQARAAVSTDVVTRGSFRTFALTGNVADGGVGVFEMTADHEMDVSAVTISVGVTVPGTIFQGYAYLDLSPNTLNHSYPFFVSSSGTQTISLTFPDPIPMRAGDLMIFFPFEANMAVNAFYRASFAGTVPGAARPSGIMAR